MTKQLLEAGADIGVGGGQLSSGLSIMPIMLILRVWVDVDISLSASLDGCNLGSDPSAYFINFDVLN